MVRILKKKIDRCLKSLIFERRFSTNTAPSKQSFKNPTDIPPLQNPKNRLKGGGIWSEYPWFLEFLIRFAILQPLMQTLLMQIFGWKYAAHRMKNCITMKKSRFLQSWRSQSFSRKTPVFKKIFFWRGVFGFLCEPFRQNFEFPKMKGGVFSRGGLFKGGYFWRMTVIVSQG